MFFRCGFPLLFVFVITFIGYVQAVALKGDCSGQGVTCDGDLVCQYGTCRAKIGDNCLTATSTDECVQNIRCTTANQPCACPAHQVANANNTGCVAISNVGGVCTREVECLTNGACGADGKCACKTNYVSSYDSSSCKLAVNQTCSGSGECVENSDCTATKCACRTGFTANNGRCDAVPVSGNCTGGKTCVDNSVCEGNICKIASGTNCTGHENDCVDGATCSTNKQCTCHSWRSPTTQNGPCGAVPAQGAAGGSCATTSPACTGQDLVCEDSICKIKHGADCTRHTDLCVKNAACPTSGAKNCSCDSTKFSATEQGVCAAKSGASSLLASLLFVVGLLGTSGLH